ncbi:unnamed protein product [Vicia faba]|uniref:Uncharacterized protein n=1 Tax=Vicia faba TaxID=3906 RepID=A0AAV1ALE5_VICFA|nr:unnamed protein product [Vicia faba]
MGINKLDAIQSLDDAFLELRPGAARKEIKRTEEMLKDEKCWGETDEDINYHKALERQRNNLLHTDEALILPDQTWTVTTGSELKFERDGGIPARHSDAEVSESTSRQKFEYG